MGESDQLILVVEDDGDVRQLLHTVLEDAGFNVAEAVDGHDALRQFHQLKPDAVVLDVGLPELDGWGVLRTIRILGPTPLLMLTALGTERDKVRGLDSGADDYIVKPFANKELVSRVRALCRRAPNKDGAASLSDGPLHVDLLGHRVTQYGEAVQLTRIEFSLLAVLVRHKGMVLSPAQLLERVWLDPSAIGENKVKFAVRRLRGSMGWDKERGPIETVRGIGYSYRGFLA